MQILIGTDNSNFSLKKYSQEFNFLEYQETYKSFVKKKTLRTIREKVGNNFSFSIKAPMFLMENTEIIKRFSSNIPQIKKDKIENYGMFKPTEENAEISKILLKEVNNLDADAVIFYTSNKFYPTDENLKNINRYFKEFSKELKKDDRDVFWSPLGFWTNEHIYKAIEGTFVIPAYDPLMDEIETNSIVNYFLMRGFGRYSKGYSDSALEKLAEIIFEKGMDTYVVFQGNYQISNARRLNEIIKYW